MSTLTDWTGEVCADLELTGTVDPAAVTDPVLDLARDVAHGVARPAAPLTAFLVGVAVGRLVERGTDPGVATRELAERTAAAARARTGSADPAGRHRGPPGSHDQAPARPSAASAP